MIMRHPDELTDTRARAPEQEALPRSNQNIFLSSPSLFSSSLGSVAIQGWAGTQHFLDGLVSSSWAGHSGLCIFFITAHLNGTPVSLPWESFRKMPEGQCSRVQVIQKLFWMYEGQTNKTNSRIIVLGFWKADLSLLKELLDKILLESVLGGKGDQERQLILMDSLLRTRRVFSNMQAWQKASTDKLGVPDWSQTQKESEWKVEAGTGY